MEEWLNKPEDTRVSIPKDEEVQPDTEEETNSTETGVDEPDAEEGLKELTPEEYQKLQSKLYAIGSEANKSIVTVTGVTSDVDWFNTPYERQGQAKWSHYCGYRSGASDYDRAQGHKRSKIHSCDLP